MHLNQFYWGSCLIFFTSYRPRSFSPLLSKDEPIPSPASSIEVIDNVEEFVRRGEIPKKLKSINLPC